MISIGDSEDNERLEQGQDTNSGVGQCRGKPLFLCLLLDVVNHKRVKTEYGVLHKTYLIYIYVMS